MQLRIQTRFCLILIAVMIAVFAISIGVSCYDLHRGAVRLAELEAEYDRMLVEVSELREELAFVGTDEYVERVARDELSMLMPGEIRYVSSK